MQIFSDYRHIQGRNYKATQNVQCTIVEFKKFMVENINQHKMCNVQ
jgi:hypothetical protein